MAEQPTTPPTPEEIMELVDDYADAFHAAMRPDGGIQYADGLVAKGIKDKLRAALSSRSETKAIKGAPCGCFPEGNDGDCPAPGCDGKSGCGKCGHEGDGHYSTCPTVETIASSATEAIKLLRDVDRHLTIAATERDVAARNSAFDIAREAVADFLAAADRRNDHEG